jgi:protein SCO1/2
MLAFWGLVLLILAALYGWRTYERRTSAERIVAPLQSADEPTRPVKYFSLTERNGQMVTSDDLQGKVWVASFFFTNCPGVCLKLNQTIADLQKELPDTDVRYVSISVDPDNDTPERLQEYAARFQADPQRWLFLTGPMSKIKDIAERSFQVSAEKAVHSDRLIVVDRQGRMRGSFRASEPAQVLALKQKLTEIAKESS